MDKSKFTAKSLLNMSKIMRRKAAGNGRARTATREKRNLLFPEVEK